MFPEKMSEKIPFSQGSFRSSAMGFLAWVSKINCLRGALSVASSRENLLSADKIWTPSHPEEVSPLLCEGREGNMI